MERLDKVQGLKKIKKLWLLKIFLDAGAILIFSLIPPLIYSLISPVFNHFVFYEAIGIWILGLIGIISLIPFWKISYLQISFYLDKKFPVLEESTSLIFKKESELGGLEKIQVRKIENELKNLSLWFPEWFALLFKSIATLILLLLLGFILMPFHQSGTRLKGDGKYRFSVLYPKTGSPGIKKLLLKIHPPEYLKKKSYTTDQGNIKVEDGSFIEFQISSNIPVSRAFIVLNGSDSIPLPRGPTQSFTYSRVWNRTGFYQISLDGHLSETYSLEVIPDRIPSLNILSPIPNKKIEAGEKPEILLKATGEDDYGIVQFVFHGTLAKGSGESVKFKEFSEPLMGTPLKKENGRNYEIFKTWNLSHFGMSPGDELYYFIEAIDTHHQSML